MKRLHCFFRQKFQYSLDELKKYIIRVHLGITKLENIFIN